MGLLSIKYSQLFNDVLYYLRLERMLLVRIGFKYPPIERGMDINIVSGLFFGVKAIYADGEKATLINKRRGQYSYYDPNLGRDRIIAVVLPIADYPQFYIDGKEYKLFPRIKNGIKIVAIVLPLIYTVFWQPSVIFFAFILAVINIFLNISLIKIMRSDVLRIIFTILMTAAGAVLTYVIVNVFYELFVDWGLVKPETTETIMLLLRNII